MNCWILIAASMVSCPWGRQVVYTEYCHPVPVVCLPSRPVVVYSTAISPPVAAQVQDVVTENAVYEEPVAAVAAEASSSDAIANAAGEELVTEPASFQGSFPLTLEEMALDWGVAVIGPGTLYPQDYAVVSSGGFFGGGSGSDSGGPSASNIPTPGVDGDPIPGPGPAGPGANPVPEPVSVVVWAFAMLAVWWYRRQQMAKLVPVPVSSSSRS